MSLLRSFLQQHSSPPKRRDSNSFSQSSHELPLYRTQTRSPTIPQNLADSVFPPAPIASSVHAATLRLQEEAATDDELLALRRREKYLQEKLQSLLDAQADGLIAGLAGGAENGSLQEEDSIRSGSSTPTVQSVQRGSRSKSPAYSKSGRHGQTVGLRAARRGIWQTIRQLSAVKSAEDGYLETDQHEDARVLQQLDAWERKRTGLHREITDIEREEGGETLQNLHGQADRLGEEIQEMEISLAQMKSRHRQLLDEIAGIENSVQSKLSSYQNSLRELDSDIQSFLKRAPEREDQSASITSPFLMLPAKRRTLSIAKEYWQDKLTDVEKTRKHVQVERDALDEGAVVWKEVVNTVTDFESVLKEEMAGLALENDKERLRQRTATLVERMEQTLRSIQGRFTSAQEKDWKLLICCIGAELEAFTRGKEILDSLLRPEEPEEQQSNGHARPPEPSVQHGAQQKTSARSSPQRKHRIASPPAKTKLLGNDSDDDPDPELLISHQQDTDDD